MIRNEDRLSVNTFKYRDLSNDKLSARHRKRQKMKFIFTFSGLPLRMSATAFSRAVLRHLWLQIRVPHSWHTFFWPEYKICNQIIYRKNNKWCWEDWSVNVAGTECSFSYYLSVQRGTPCCVIYGMDSNKSKTVCEKCIGRNKSQSFWRSWSEDPAEKHTEHGIARGLLDVHERLVKLGCPEGCISNMSLETLGRTAINIFFKLWKRSFIYQWITSSIDFHSFRSFIFIFVC